MPCARPPLAALVLATVCALASLARAEENESPPPTAWHRIRYTDVPCPWGEGRLTATVNSPRRDWLQLELSFFVHLEPLRLPGRGDVSVRLHLMNGAVHKPTDGEPEVAGFP
jgi:hypothetical protein